MAIEIIKVIVKALDCVLLALQQAKAVLSEGMPLRKFLGFYESQYKELMAHKPARSAWFYDKNMSISSTFGMVVSKLGEDEDANRLLSIISCFGPRTIPIELLAQYAALENVLRESRPAGFLKSQNESDPNTMESKWLTTLVQNKLKLRFAINRLESLCLLKTRRNIDGTVLSFSLHRSLCRWRLETLEEVQREH